MSLFRQDLQRTQKAHMENVAEPAHLYQRVREGQILFPKGDPILSILNSGLDVNPEPFGRQDIFVFAPTRWEIVPGYPDRLPCGHCGSWNTADRGWPDSPFSRTIVGHEDAQLVQTRHYCSDCKRSFMSGNPRTLALLPDWIQDQFPGVSSHRKILSRQFHDIQTVLHQQRFSTTQIAKLLNSLRGLDLLRKETSYYSALLTIKENHDREKQTTLDSMQEEIAQARREWTEPPRFPEAGLKETAFGRSKLSGMLLALRWSGWSPNCWCLRISLISARSANK